MSQNTKQIFLDGLKDQVNDFMSNYIDINCGKAAIDHTTIDKNGMDKYIAGELTSIYNTKCQYTRIKKLTTFYDTLIKKPDDGLFKTIVASDQYKSILDLSIKLYFSTGDNKIMNKYQKDVIGRCTNIYLRHRPFDIVVIYTNKYNDLYKLLDDNIKLSIKKMLQKGKKDTVIRTKKEKLLSLYCINEMCDKIIQSTEKEINNMINIDTNPKKNHDLGDNVDTNPKKNHDLDDDLDGDFDNVDQVLPITDDILKECCSGVGKTVASLNTLSTLKNHVVTLNDNINRTACGIDRNVSGMGKKDVSLNVISTIKTNCIIMLNDIIRDILYDIDGNIDIDKLSGIIDVCQQLNTYNLLVFMRIEHTFAKESMALFRFKLWSHYNNIFGMIDKIDEIAILENCYYALYDEKIGSDRVMAEFFTNNKDKLNKKIQDVIKMKMCKKSPLN